MDRFESTEGFEATMSETSEMNTDTDAPPQSEALNTANPKIKQIWAIGGGKGGVGKSLIAANLAISLARNGHKVCAVDLDLGCANLHTCLGVEIPTVTLSDFFSKRVTEIENVVVQTPTR